MQIPKKYFQLKTAVVLLTRAGEAAHAASATPSIILSLPCGDYSCAETTQVCQ